ncbi:MAG: DUF6808 domain-containing protein [Candidatus Cryptobacteroides sp.]
MKNTLSVIAFVLLLAASFAAGRFTAGRKCPDAGDIEKTDTLIIRDTFVERMPVPFAVLRTDTMLVAVRDTVTIRDTAYIVVEREQKHYRGEEYEAWVSGYRPELDSLRVFPRTQIVTKTISASPRKRWGIGLQVGYGVGISGGRVIGSPYIGIGVSYDILQW